jgi:hypothetical protein
MVVSDSVGILQEATARGAARTSVVMDGVGSVVTLRASRLKHAPLTSLGIGEMVSAAPKGSARFGLKVTIGALSQDDVTGAVLDVEVEPGLTLRKAIQLIAAASAGAKENLAAGGIGFRSAGSGHKRRISANSDRTVVTTDLT